MGGVSAVTGHAHIASQHAADCTVVVVQNVGSGKAGENIHTQSLGLLTQELGVALGPQMLDRTVLARIELVRLTIPRRSTEKRRGPFDKAIYKTRNLIERLIAWRAAHKSEVEARASLRTLRSLVAKALGLPVEPPRVPPP